MLWKKSKEKKTYDHTNQKPLLQGAHRNVGSVFVFFNYKFNDR